MTEYIKDYSYLTNINEYGIRTMIRRKPIYTYNNRYSENELIALAYQGRLTPEMVEGLNPDYVRNILGYEPINELNELNELKEIMETTIQTQAAAIAVIRAKQYVVGSVDASGSFSLASHPRPHDTKSSARSECARLAKSNPGKMYVFMCLEGAELVPTTYVSI